jgi:hypothetical protein
MTKAFSILASASEVNVLAEASEVAVAEKSENPGNASVFGVQMTEVYLSD